MARQQQGQACQSYPVLSLAVRERQQGAKEKHFRSQHFLQKRGPVSSACFPVSCWQGNNRAIRDPITVACQCVTTVRSHDRTFYCGRLLSFVKLWNSDCCTKKCMLFYPPSRETVSGYQVCQSAVRFFITRFPGHSPPSQSNYHRGYLTQPPPLLCHSSANLVADFCRRHNHSLISSLTMGGAKTAGSQDPVKMSMSECSLVPTSGSLARETLLNIIRSGPAAATAVIADARF